MCLRAEGYGQGAEDGGGWTVSWQMTSLSLPHSIQYVKQTSASKVSTLRKKSGNLQSQKVYSQLSG